MGRLSLAEQFHEEPEGEPEEPGQGWLILYDLRGVKVSTNFWTNLKKLMSLSAGSSLIQLSEFNTPSKRVAKATRMLRLHPQRDNPIQIADC